VRAVGIGINAFALAIEQILLAGQGAVVIRADISGMAGDSAGAAILVIARGIGAIEAGVTGAEHLVGVAAEYALAHGADFARRADLAARAAVGVIGLGAGAEWDVVDVQAAALLRHAVDVDAAGIRVRGRAVTGDEDQCRGDPKPSSCDHDPSRVEADTHLE
jgi:hypothetical protein